MHIGTVVRIHSGSSIYTQFTSYVLNTKILIHVVKAS